MFFTKLNIKAHLMYISLHYLEFLDSSVNNHLHQTQVNEIWANGELEFCSL